MGSDQPLNIERWENGNETSNVKEEVAGECRVINRPRKIRKRDDGVE
jgi:hypothetical protein